MYVSIYLSIYIFIRGQVCQGQGSTFKSSVEVADGSSEKRKDATLASTYRAPRELHYNTSMTTY